MKRQIKKKNEKGRALAAKTAVRRRVSRSSLPFVSFRMSSPVGSGVELVRRALVLASDRQRCTEFYRVSAADSWLVPRAAFFGGFVVISFDSTRFYRLLPGFNGFT